MRTLPYFIIFITASRQFQHYFCCLLVQKGFDMILKRHVLYGIGVIAALIFVADTPVFAQKKKNKKEEKQITIYEVDTLVKPVPLNRSGFHKHIDDEQLRADMRDGRKDGIVTYSEDTGFSNALSKAIIRDVDQMQIMIENMPINPQEKLVEGQMRIRYLRAVENMLRKYNNDTRVDPVYYKKLVANLHDMIVARNEGKLLDFVKANTNIYSLNNAELLDESPEARYYLYTEMGKQEPQMMIKRLKEYANEPYADEIIATAAKVVPQEVYNYASSTNYTLSNAVKRSKDPLVQTIVQIAEKSRSPLLAMPFLSDIYNKRKTIAEVDAITANDDQFFKNLVRLKLSGETLAGDTYSDELQYRGLKYVRTMNDLHESQDAVRFKCIEGFSPEELYFLMVYGQDEIYTSSFLGTFKRMMERMNGMKGDELLDKVHYDHFRTFIRMCAGYNTLSTFLATIGEDQKTKLMRDFIADLEKGKENELEDAVDVADAFGSIRDTTLSDFLLKEVRGNYERCANIKSKKGVIVYGLLATLFRGSKAGDGSTSQISDELNLPSINLVPYKKLLSDSGVVYEQFFFFGDEDGKTSMASFMSLFRSPDWAGKWKITEDKYWITIRSLVGKPVVIYANRPLPEPEDEEAQDKLTKYLEDQDIHPAILVHRGHSYHLPLTIDKMTENSKIVMLGSCGGYHNLALVLDHSPDANIISSKQVGTMRVNEPIIRAINNQLLNGNDINWVEMWQSLGLYFEKMPDVKALFNDYVPPHKNLGAIFIKAYRRISYSTEK